MNLCFCAVTTTTITAHNFYVTAVMLFLMLTLRLCHQPPNRQDMSEDVKRSIGPSAQEIRAKVKEEVAAITGENVVKSEAQNNNNTTNNNTSQSSSSTAVKVKTE